MNFPFFTTHYIFLAAAEGNFEKVSSAVADGFSVKKTHFGHESLLKAAVCGLNPELVHFLCAAGAKLKSRQELMESFKYLFDVRRGNRPRGENALERSLAISRIVELLVLNHPDYVKSDFFDFVSLWQIVSTGGSLAANALANIGADFSVINENEPERLLLDDVLITTSHRMTDVEVANTFIKLLNLGAPYKKKVKGLTMLTKIVDYAYTFNEFGNDVPRMINALLAKGDVDVNELNDDGQGTALDWLLSVPCGVLHASILLQHGCRLLVKEKYAEYAKRAVVLNLPGILTALSKEGYVVTSHSNLLYMAVSMGDSHTLIAKELIQLGISVNERFDFDQTALYVAATNESVEMTKLLLAAGADPAAKIKSGETCLGVAEHKLVVQGENPRRRAVYDLIKAESDKQNTEPDPQQ